MDETTSRIQSGRMSGAEGWQVSQVKFASENAVTKSQPAGVNVHKQDQFRLFPLQGHETVQPQRTAVHGRGLGGGRETREAALRVTVDKHGQSGGGGGCGCTLCDDRHGAPRSGTRSAVNARIVFSYPIIVYSGKNAFYG